MNSQENNLETHFAPAGRDPSEQLEQKATLVRDTPLVQRTIDAMTDAVLLLNEQRQVVAANQTVEKMLNCSIDTLLGKRPGELLGCSNASQGPNGCGTAHGCATCGAVNAILESHHTEDRVIRECRITLNEPVGGALDMKVSAMGFRVENHRFTVCVLTDISDQKRLAVLTRTFFHDVMNTAGGIQGFAELLQETVASKSEDKSELAELQGLTDQLVEEIQAQRDLIYAESGDLEPESAPVQILVLLARIQTLYKKHPVARDRQLILEETWPGSIETDQRILGRVLGNMIKNALEATKPGGKVTVRCYEEPPRDVVFSVHNAGVIPQDIQMQIFQRSFSTKAKSGRGIGTHSMKLFGERYLGGKIEFTSRESEGTIFKLTLPKVITYSDF